ELTISVDRAKASQMGVSVQDVSKTLQLALSNRRLGYFTKNGKQYQVLGQVYHKDREAPIALNTLFVRNNTGTLVSIDNFISFEETTSPSQIYHYNRYKSATISANLAPGQTIGDGLAVMNEI